MKILENFEIVTDELGNGTFIKYTGEATDYADIPFAEFQNVEKILLSYRAKAWFGVGKAVDKISEIPYESQWICFKNSDNTYTVLFALAHEPLRAAFCGRADNALGICLETGDTTTKATDRLCVYTATGSDFYALIDNAYESIANALKTCTLRETKKAPDFMNYFGWCTWDSFYEKVTEEDVERGLENFKEGGFVPRFLLLDDGWQTVCEEYDNRGLHKLSSFNPNGKFNHTLKNVAKTAKEKYGVKYFYVWHALLGYWGGVEPKSEEMKKYEPRFKDIKFTDSLHNVHPDVPEFSCGVPSSDKLFDFYCDYHRGLAEAGVDGVKVDVQFNCEAAGENDGGRVRMARKYREALEASVNLNFNGGLINCMPGSNDLTYHTKASNVTRTSDDFFPTAPESHGKHIFNNAVNSLWIGGFTHCDWDMFQTKHKFGAFHAASRAVSGSPIYVSDRVDEHDFDIIKKLTTSDGKLLMAEKTARPTLDSLFVDESFNEIYKIFNYNKFGGVIAAFNLTSDEAVMTKTVKPSDIYGYDSGEYAVYSHIKGEFYKLKAHEEITVSLKGIEYDIFTVVPIISGKAVMGLTDKYNSGGAVLNVYNHGGNLYAILSGGGNAAVYSEEKPVKILIDGKEAQYTYKNSVIEVSFESDDEAELSVIY